MTNENVVRLLRNMAATLTIKGANRFRINAYDKAADSIEHLTSEAKDLWDEGKLDTIPGVGKTIAGYLEELFRTGKIKHFEAEFKKISPAVFEFLEIPGIGPKRAYELTTTFNISSAKNAVDQLEKVAKQGKIAPLPGWGEKSQQEVLEGIESFKKGAIKEKRMNLPYADQLAKDVMEYLQKIPEVKQIAALGSLRRKVATIGDIDLAVATEEPKVVLDAFVKYPQVFRIVDRGDKGATVLLKVGRQVDLRVQHPQAFGAMLQYFTGSKHHNIRLREFALKQGLSLSEHGIKPITSVKRKALSVNNFNKKLKLYEFGTEEEFYKVLGMDYIPPELREDNGEIEAAFRQAQGIRSGLPSLVEIKDIKGDLHVHSNYDLKPSHDLGSSDLTELLDKAAELNYEYLGISDHNPKVSQLNERQIADILKQRKANFEKKYSSWQKRAKKRVNLFIMLEVDIDPNGKIALPKGAEEYLDAFIVSVHSAFKLTKTEMTGRILKALAHPKAKILGHPTGRLLGARESYEADWPQIFKFCNENNKALEINSWPERLDLPDRLVKEAIDQGVKLIIDTDSHDQSQMPLLTYGVDVARRGWAEKKDILNTLGYNDFSRWLKS